MNTTELQNNRKKILKKLRAIKKEAYSGLTCREYEAISLPINYIETLSMVEKLKREADNDSKRTY